MIGMKSTCYGISHLKSKFLLHIQTQKNCSTPTFLKPNITQTNPFLEDVGERFQHFRILYHIISIIFREDYTNWNTRKDGKKHILKQGACSWTSSWPHRSRDWIGSPRSPVHIYGEMGPALATSQFRVLVVIAQDEFLDAHLIVEVRVLVWHIPAIYTLLYHPSTFISSTIGAP